jgi:hypothetical protein
MIELIAELAAMDCVKFDEAYIDLRPANMITLLMRNGTAGFGPNGVVVLRGSVETVDKAEEMLVTTHISNVVIFHAIPGH